MRINTRDMGFVDVAPDQVVTFVQPILGFESFRAFALLPIADAAPFHCLQSLDEARCAFPLVAAAELGVTYHPENDLVLRLRAASRAHLRFWVIVVPPTEDAPIRVNLRAPVVVNHVLHIAAQTIMREEYPISHALDACRERDVCLAK